jgi:hypothetical protein
MAALYLEPRRAAHLEPRRAAHRVLIVALFFAKVFRLYCGAFHKPNFTAVGAMPNLCCFLEEDV